MTKLLPVSFSVFAILMLFSVVLILADIVNPVNIAAAGGKKLISGVTRRIRSASRNRARYRGWWINGRRTRDSKCRCEIQECQPNG